MLPRTKGGKQIEAFETAVRTAGHQLQVVQEIGVLGGGVVETVYVDFTIHFVDGTACEIGFQLDGEFGIFVLRSQVKGMRTDVVDRCLEIESGYLTCRVDGSVQGD